MNEQNNTTETTKTVNRPLVYISVEDALKKAARSGKNFNLYRSVYQSKRNQLYYFDYKVFLTIPTLRRKEITVSMLPDIGFVTNKTTSSEKRSLNSSSYRTLNWLCDAGMSLKLIVKNTGTDDKPYFQFFALAIDEEGHCAECLMKPRNPGDERFIQSAFCEFGKCREASEEDLVKSEYFQEQWKSVYMGGEYPDDIKVEDDVE